VKALLFAGLGLALAAPAPTDKFIRLDLKDKCNHKLAEKFGGRREGNDLPLEIGDQKLEGVKFKIGEGVIQLGSLLATDDPEKVEGIKVDETFAKLHVLHATAWGRGPNAPGTDQCFVEDGTDIGEYQVHFADGSMETIPIVYGKDVRDWWYDEKDKGVTRGKVAWKGENAATKNLQAGIRLYMTTWENPRPDKKVASIDYVGRKNDTAAAPFCLAITLERK
jgi:hypothetical protein